MNAKNNKRSACVSSKKVTISNNSKRLTCQASLVPVVIFLRNCGMIGLINETGKHERGANALYDSVEALFLTVVATIGGVRALSGVITVWADGVLRRLVGAGLRFLTTAPLVLYFGHLESGRYLNLRHGIIGCVGRFGEKH